MLRATAQQGGLRRFHNTSDFRTGVKASSLAVGQIYYGIRNLERAAAQPEKSEDLVRAHEPARLRVRVGGFFCLKITE